MDTSSMPPPPRKRRFDELDHDAVRDYTPVRDAVLPVTVRASDEPLVRATLAMAMALKSDTFLLPHTFNLAGVDTEPRLLMHNYVDNPEGVKSGYYEITISFHPATQFQSVATRAISDVNPQRVRDVRSWTNWEERRQHLQYIVYSMDAQLPDEMLEMQIVRIKRVPRRTVHVPRVAPAGGGLLAGFFG